MRESSARGRWPAAVVATFACVVVPACYGADLLPERHHFHFSEDADGVTTGVTSGGPKYEGELFVYEKVREIRGDDATPGSVLALPSALVMDDEGRLYVGDRQAAHIVVYEDGRYARTIGRRGEGPGEFQRVSQIGLAGDALWAVDGAGRHLQLFELDGSFVERIPFPPLPRRGSFAPTFWMGPDRRLIVFDIEQDEDRTNVRPIITILDASETQIGSVVGSWVRMYDRVTAPGDDRATMLRIHFGGFPQADYAPGRGIYVTSGVQPVVDVYDVDGKLSQRFRIDAEPQAIGEDERRAVEEAAQRRLDEAASPSGEGQPPNAARIEALRFARDNLRYAETKAFWVRCYVDDAGYVWLLRPSETGTGERTTWRFWLLAPDGELLGATTTPGFGTAMKGHFLAIEADPQTGDYVPTVYRIRAAVEGFEYR